MAPPPPDTGPPPPGVAVAPPPRTRPGPLPAEGSPPARIGGKSIVLSGTLVVVDTQGRSHTQADGIMTLILWVHPSMGDHHQVHVQGGRWTTEVPSGISMEGGTARMDGRLAAVELKRSPVPESGTLALEARWIEPTVLHVLDAATGRPIGPIDVSRRRQWVSHEADLVHPGAEAGLETLHAAVDAPLRLPESTVEREIYWIRSAGYAWGQIEIHHRRGGPHVLRLAPGGALEIAISNPTSDQEVVLRLRARGSPTSGPLVELRPDEHGLSHIDHLATGTYTVSAELGHWRAEHSRLAEANVEVGPGTTAPVSLTLNQSRDSEPPVALAGTLITPRAWNLEKPPILRIMSTNPRSSTTSPGESVHAIAVEGSSDTEWRWDGGEVLSGSCDVSVSLAPARAPGLWVSFRVETASSDAGALRLVLPDPADVSLELTDEVSGEALDVQGLEWHVWSGDGVTAGPSDLVTRAADETRFTFRAPVGTLSVQPVPPADLGTPARTSLRAGHNDVRLGVPRGDSGH